MSKVHCEVILAGSVLSEGVADIMAMDRDRCVEAWRKSFGTLPPRFTSLVFMQKTLAYELQIKTYGGHSLVVRRRLEAISRASRGNLKEDSKPKCDNSNVIPSASGSTGTARAQKRKSTKPKPLLLSLRTGTHLVREWNGRTYQVEALEKGFRLDGKTYRSLSAIAKKITGAHWSGPRFFGLES